MFDDILKINAHFFSHNGKSPYILEIYAKIFKDEMGNCQDWYQNSSVERRDWKSRHKTVVL